MKTLSDNNKNETLRIFDYSTGDASGSIIFADAEERERIREHVQKRLNNFLSRDLIDQKN